MHGFAKILFTIFLNTERPCSRPCSSVSEYCYGGEWLVLLKYTIEYSHGFRLIAQADWQFSSSDSAQAIQLSAHAHALPRLLRAFQS